MLKRVNGKIEVQNFDTVSEEKEDSSNNQLTVVDSSFELLSAERKVQLQPSMKMSDRILKYVCPTILDWSLASHD